jgi:hypothetical protein
MVSYKKHFIKMKNALGDKAGITFLTVPNAYHNPTYTEKAINAKRDFQAKLKRALKKNKLSTAQACESFVNGFDWYKITEQNEAVWAKIYEFLEKYLGCRFYTATFEKVPQNATITVDISEDKQIPVFETRNSFWYDYWNHDISVKLKLNCRVEDIEHLLFLLLGRQPGFGGPVQIENRCYPCGAKLSCRLGRVLIHLLPGLRRHAAHHHQKQEYWLHTQSISVCSLPCKYQSRQ